MRPPVARTVIPATERQLMTNNSWLITESISENQYFRGSMTITCALQNSTLGRARAGLAFVRLLLHLLRNPS